MSVAKQVAEQTPVLLGSGVSAENLSEWMSLADGFIVGTALKEAVARIGQSVWKR